MQLSRFARPWNRIAAYAACRECPVTANDTTCAAELLYDNWDTARWYFGSNTQ